MEFDPDLNAHTQGLCVVCGDTANGNNFGVPSCESCKAFFRRNSNKELECNFENKCKVDKFTRKFCQLCRQKKCFGVGMKKEMLKTETKDKRTRKRKCSNTVRLLLEKKPEARIQPRTLKDEDKATKHDAKDDITATSSQNVQVSAPINIKQKKSWDNTVKGEAYKVKQEQQDQTRKSLKSLIDAAIDTEFQGSGEPPCAQLNDREKARINELYIAAKSLDEPFKESEEEVLNLFQMEPSLVSVMNLTNLAIKRIIQFAKQLSSFSRLCQEDQVVLLKGGCLELMLLRSVLTYSSEKNSWQLPQMNASPELSMDVLKEASLHGVNLYEEHQRFASSFSDIYKGDETIMLLLSAIALFSHDRPNLTHQSVVRMEQDSYYYLLKRYLESRFSGCTARDAYLQLIGKLLHLRELNESHLQLFMEMNPSEIEPLLREIFDLNQTKI